jgi:hypothetical protein
MEKIHRRSFCAASLLAFPVVKLFAEDNNAGNICSEPDPIMDALADEFTRTTLDGARNGFGAVHFRQYAGQVRIFNAHLNAKGTVGRLNRMLDEDNYNLVDPDRAASIATEYWKKRGIVLNEGNLSAQLSSDAESYGLVKNDIKRRGGVQALHERIAEAFERKAEEYSTAVYRGRLAIRNGVIVLPAAVSSSPTLVGQAQFINTQFDIHAFIGADIDCLCKAMLVEGAALSILCALIICPPCCVSAAFLLGMAIIMEQMGMCKPSEC